MTTERTGDRRTAALYIAVVLTCGFIAGAKDYTKARKHGYRGLPSDTRPNCSSILSTLSMMT